MPTYPYACTACDHRFEVVQSFSDDPLTQCPVCSGRLRKVFSSVGIVFKGSGFYRTDSRSDSKGSSGIAANSGSTGSGEKSAAPTGSSSDSSASTASGTAKTSSAPAATASKVA